MANIIYNTNPQRPEGQPGVHWLVSIIEGFRQISHTDDTIRISRNFVDGQVSYIVRNMVTRTRAMLYGKGREITIEIYKLALPDVSQIQRPRYTNFEVFGKFDMSNEGFVQASEFLTKELEAPTDYSKEGYPRIKFGLHPSTPNVFLGGKIKAFSYAADHYTTSVLLENKNSVQSLIFYFKLNGYEEGDEMIGKYVIANNDRTEAVQVHPKALFQFYEQID